MSKRFYWMKLKENFMTSDTVDFLMSQPNGAEYVVLYQMLCLQTLNTDGVLGRTIGEVMIPYDAAKIQRDCKYFSIDTVTLALEYYKKLGLVFEQDNGFLKIANYENIIGSESDVAERVRRHRALKESEESEKQEVLHCNAARNENVTLEIEMRDRDINTHSIRVSGDAPVCAHVDGVIGFEPPTLDEVKAFVEARELEHVDAERFYNWFSASGWYRGKTRIVDWQAEALNWERGGIEEEKRHTGIPPRAPTDKTRVNSSRNFKERTYSAEELKSVMTRMDDLDENDV